MKTTIIHKSNHYNNAVFLTVLLVISISLFSCQKFLDEKPEKSAVIPSSLDDLQEMLDNNTVMNGNSPASLAELLADNYYILPTLYQSQVSSFNENNRAEASNYIWASQTIPFQRSWNDSYLGPIYYSNIVLDQLPLITYNSSEQEKFDQIKGSALFYRSFHFSQLAQIYMRPYSTENAGSDGIVLRITSNVSAKSTRATVEQTYNQIISDLKEAAEILPNTTLYKTRPTKAAAYALLARVYLSMRKYEEAGEYADKALQVNNELINYNTLSPIGSDPITIFNKEVIFHSSSANPLILGRTRGRIDSTLFNSYEVDDLRKQVFFTTLPGFRGSYYGLIVDRVFDGLTTDELYLIRAEAFVRTSKIPEALADLNALMINRWRDGLFVPFNTADPNEALDAILEERRKELLYRGLRWPDIRRLNLENRDIALQRNISGTIFTLPPNDNRSVALIPWDEINRSNLQQNPR